MTDLSPAAKAVLDAVEDDCIHPDDKHRIAAAALRAAATHLPMSAMYPSSDWGYAWRTGIKDAERKLLAIADELEGAS